MDRKFDFQKSILGVCMHFRLIEYQMKRLKIIEKLIARLLTFFGQVEVLTFE